MNHDLVNIKKFSLPIDQIRQARFGYTQIEVFLCLQPLLLREVWSITHLVKVLLVRMLDELQHETNSLCSAPDLPVAKLDGHSILVSLLSLTGHGRLSKEHFVFVDDRAVVSAAHACDPTEIERTHKGWSSRVYASSSVPVGCVGSLRLSVSRLIIGGGFWFDLARVLDAVSPFTVERF
jgi:hypothetical protein